MKQLRSFNQIYSMIPPSKLSEYLYEIATDENRVGSKRRGRKREQISGVRDIALDTSGNGMDWIWPLVKKGCQSIFSKTNQ